MTAPHQRAADPHASAWVAANAGSGKTFVLISRLVTLMLSGATPDQLLCLTYTRGAAAEMQGRLFDLLSTWALLSDDPLRDEIKQRTGLDVRTSAELYRARTLFAQALESPGGLKIQTIHAFCEALLHRFPLEAGLAPGFSLLDEFETRRVVEQLAQGLVEEGALPPLAEAIDALARHMPADQFADLPHAIVATRSRFELYQETMDGYLDRILPVRPLGKVEADRSALYAKLQACLAPIGDAVNDAGTANDRKKWQDLSSFTVDPSILQDDDAAWEILAKFFLTKTGTMRATLLTNAVRTAQPEAYEKLEQCQQHYVALDQEYRIHNSREMSRKLHVYAAELLTHYDTYKLRHQRLDYDDLIARVNGLLGHAQSAAWVLYKIDAGLDHILIDEAQDTSPQQWRVVAALADEFFADSSGHLSRGAKVRTVFAVGDEKQSIFSFQGADPAEFDRMRHHFAQLISASEQKFHEVALKQSRRSTPEVLQVVDAVFAAEGARAGLTASGAALSHPAFREQAPGYVELWPLMTSEKKTSKAAAWEVPDATLVQSGQQKLAQAIAHKIGALLKEPDIAPGDILVLVRQRNAFFTDILRALRQAEIPIAGADRMKLLEELVVKDLRNAADMALNPNNDLAVAIFLRGPFGNISEEELFEIAYQRAGTLHDAIDDYVRKGMASPALISARERMAWLIAEAEKIAPFDYFSQFLSVLGGQECLYRRLGFEVDDAVSEVLRLALNFERQSPASLQMFLEWLSGNATEVKREFEQDVNAVRVMTVHGAKGLEAPIVFLPDGCRLSSRANRTNIAVHGGDLRWQPQKKNMSSYDQRLLDDRLSADYAESQRLLYVALTRAQDRLYIGGYLPANIKEPHPHSWYAQLSALFPPPEDTPDLCWALGDEAKAGPFKEKNEVERNIAPLPDWARRSVSPESAAADATHQTVSVSALVSDYVAGLPQTEKSGSSAAGQLDQGAAAQRGNFIHRLLQFLPDVPQARRSAALQAMCQPYADGGMGDVKAIVEEVERILALDLLAPIFSDKARSECAVQGRVLFGSGALKYIIGQVDRMVIDERSGWLVDFKTGMPQLENPAYWAQMAIYRHLVQGATGIEDIRCALVWTQNAGVEDIPVKAMDEIFSIIQQQPS